MKNSLYKVLILVTIIFSNHLYSQPKLEWEKRIYTITEKKSSIWGTVNSIQQTNDNGYILGGSYSFDRKALLIKTDSIGNMIWVDTFELEDSFFQPTTINCVQQTNDNGFILIGNRQLKNKIEDPEIWVAKIDLMGKIQWTKSFGSMRGAIGNSIIQTSDGGYILGGENIKSIYKLTSLGDLEWSWSKKFIRSDGDTSDMYWDIKSLYQVSGDNIIGIGTYGIVKLNLRGNELWIKYFYDENLKLGELTNNGGLILLGVKNLISVDSIGTIIWSREYKDYFGCNEAYALLPLKNGECIVAGQSRNVFSGMIDPYNRIIIKTDKHGLLTWANKGHSSDGASWNAICRTKDNGFIVAGVAFRNEGAYYTLEKPLSEFLILNKYQYENIRPDYCLSFGENQNYEYIKSIQISNITNESQPSKYTFYSNKIINLSYGKTFPITLTPGFISSKYNEYWTIWIDYNNDGDFFDYDEALFSIQSDTIIHDSITISSSIKSPFPLRMRIAMKYGEPPIPCEYFQYGEVEEYMVIIDDYGTSYGKSQKDEFIKRISLENLDFTNKKPIAYEFVKTTPCFIFEIPRNVGVTLVPGFTANSYDEYWKIWIDYDHDGNFNESNEEVFTAHGTSEITGSFSVSERINSQTRMRISMKYGSYPTPYEIFEWGEVKDFYFYSK